MLLHVGFPNEFVIAVLNCLKGSEGRVIVNGDLTKPFVLRRGTKQGDPMSPSLFILVVEMLNHTLQMCDIQGNVSLRKEAEKVLLGEIDLLFADDAAACAAGLRDEERIWTCFKQFKEASALETNVDKCIRISWCNEKEVSVLVPEVKELENGVARYLGASITCHGTVKPNWYDILVDAANKWKDTVYPLHNAANVFKTYVLGKIWYFELFTVKNEYLFEVVEKMKKWFLFSKEKVFDEKGKYVARISLERLAQPKQFGGLNLWDVEA